MSDFFSRLLRLVRLLQEPRGRTVTELERLLEVDRRTIYRDLARLEAEGFPLEQKIENKRYFLVQVSVAAGLTPEETEVLTTALHTLPQQDPVVQALCQKLNLQLELQPLQHQLRGAGMAAMVRELQQAIDAKEQVVLEGYLSAHSNSSSDRLVEPISLEHHHSLLQAFEPASGLTKTFKVERIGRLGYTGVSQRHRRKHSQQLTDAFGLSGSQELDVQLQLNTRAATLLREEYPATEPYLSPNPNNIQYPFSFCGPVRSWQGIGRFILGLPGDVVVDRPEGLKGYLQEATEALL
jgi:proteasome accessory factor C